MTNKESWHTIEFGTETHPIRFDFRAATKTKAEAKKALANLNRAGTKVRTSILSEANRVYSNWRFETMKNNGRKPTFFAMRRCDFPAYERLITACLERGVTPTKYFRLVSAGLAKYPSTRFKFCEPNYAMGERTLFSYLERMETAQLENERKSGSGGRSFEDAALLNPRIRELLAEEFPEHIGVWTDRDLLIVQQSAKDIAQGERIFIPKAGGHRKMAKFLAEGLFSEK